LSSQKKHKQAPEKNCFDERAGGLDVMQKWQVGSSKWLVGRRESENSDQYFFFLEKSQIRKTSTSRPVDPYIR